MEEVREFNAERRKRVNLGLSGTSTWDQTISTDVTSPYRLGFYMIRLSVNASQYTTVSNINNVCFIILLLVSRNLFVKILF